MARHSSAPSAAHGASHLALRIKQAQRLQIPGHGEILRVHVAVGRQDPPEPVVRRRVLPVDPP
eukprot:2701192-Pyramimonas_sp.AAC.1